MKIGDKIAYLHFPADFSDLPNVGWGYIYGQNKEKIGVARLNHSNRNVYKNVGFDVYCPIAIETSDKVKDYFIEIVDEKIEGLKSKVRTLTSEEKDELVKNKFNEIQKRINATADTMLNPTDESQWINCLKEICQLKKQLFSIKIKDLDNVHKENGAIRWKIRQLEDFRKIVENFDFNINEG